MDKLNADPAIAANVTANIDNINDAEFNDGTHAGNEIVTDRFEPALLANPAKLKHFMNYQHRYSYANYHNIELDPANNKTTNFYNIDKSKVSVNGNTLRIVNAGRHQTQNANEQLADGNLNVLDPEVVNVSYENAKTTITPKAHTVKLDDKMFLLIPFSPAFSQHLFSPQKDIYNATLISITQLASPTVIKPLPLDHYIDFSQHIQNLNTLNDYNLYIGDEPTYDKDITNYKSFTTNPIYTFIELLLQKNLNEIFDPKEAIKFNNFGFDIGSVKSLTGHGLFGGTLGTSPHYLSGGYNIGDSISPRFVNSLPVISSTNEMELLSSLYNIDGTDQTSHTTSDGKQLYSYIFKSDFGGGRTDVSPSKVMFSLILNYFHKYNISFNSMFNQLCYPSILFNASALRLSIDRLNKLISRFGASHDQIDNKTYKGRVIQLVEQYIGNYVKGNDSALDKCSDYRFQIKFNDRKPDVSFTDIIDHLKREQNGPDFDKYNVLWLSNQYSCPSIANNFFTEYVKYITINPKAEKEILPIQQLFPTGISSALRHLDSISTFTSVLFMLLKQTSYYDHEYDRDTTFFNVTNPEPFSVI